MMMRALYIAAFALLLSHPASAQNAFSDPGSEVSGSGGPVGGLVAVEPKFEAGTIETGTNNSVIAQFRNESGVEIEFKDVKLFPSSNVSAQIVADQCSAEPLLAGAQCAVVMEVKGLQSGAFRVEVLARHTGRSRLVTAAVSGTVNTTSEDEVKATDVEITPNIIDFGTLDQARPIIRSVTLRNITSQEITINDLFVDAPQASGFSLNENCSVLPPGASCIASITWSPIAKGPTSGALVVQHTGSSGVVTANMTGSFLPVQTEVARAFPEPVPGKGLLVASEEEINFGSEVESQSSITVSLVNIGDAPLTLMKLDMSGSEQGLQLVDSGCGEEMTLEPTEACALTISWLPSKAGIVIDDVKVTHTGARGVLVLPVRGESVASVNIDAKPIVSTVETITTDTGATQTVVTQQAASGPPTLDGYTVTSLAKKTAIINGAGGSRMVRDKQIVRVGGAEWTVSVSPEGVAMISGSTKVLLVFDRSLSAPGTTSANSSSTGTSSSGSTPSTSAAPAPASAQ